MVAVYASAGIWTQIHQPISPDNSNFGAPKEGVVCSGGGNDLATMALAQHKHFSAGGYCECTFGGKYSSSLMLVVYSRAGFKLGAVELRLCPFEAANQPKSKVYEASM